MKETAFKPTVAIDFDGVIHRHDTAWTDAREIHDGPVDGALDFIRRLARAGFKVVIYTARAKNAAAIPYIFQWLDQNGLEERYTFDLEITAVKPGAVLYIDDRAWRFEGKFPSLRDIRTFKPWNKKRRQHGR